MTKHSRSIATSELVVRRQPKVNRGDKRKTMVIKYKVVKLLPETHERLRKLAEVKDESYDDIVSKCIDAFLEIREQQRQQRLKKEEEERRQV